MVMPRRTLFYAAGLVLTLFIMSHRTCTASSASPISLTLTSDSGYVMTDLCANNAYYCTGKGALMRSFDITSRSTSSLFNSAIYSAEVTLSFDPHIAELVTLMESINKTTVPRDLPGIDPTSLPTTVASSPTFTTSIVSPLNIIRNTFLQAQVTLFYPQTLNSSLPVCSQPLYHTIFTTDDGICNSLYYSHTPTAATTLTNSSSSSNSNADTTENPFSATRYAFTISFLAFDVATATLTGTVSGEFLYREKRAACGDTGCSPNFKCCAGGVNVPPECSLVEFVGTNTSITTGNNGTGPGTDSGTREGNMTVVNNYTTISATTRGQSLSIVFQLVFPVAAAGVDVTTGGLYRSSTGRATCNGALPDVSVPLSTFNSSSPSSSQFWQVQACHLTNIISSSSTDLNISASDCPYSACCDPQQHICQLQYNPCISISSSTSSSPASPRISTRDIIIIVASVVLAAGTGGLVYYIVRRNYRKRRRRFIVRTLWVRRQTMRLAAGLENQPRPYPGEAAAETILEEAGVAVPAVDSTDENAVSNSSGLGLGPGSGSGSTATLAEAPMIRRSAGVGKPNIVMRASQGGFKGVPPPQHQKTDGDDDDDDDSETAETTGSETELKSDRNRKKRATDNTKYRNRNRNTSRNSGTKGMNDQLRTDPKLDISADLSETITSDASNDDTTPHSSHPSRTAVKRVKRLNFPLFTAKQFASTLRRATSAPHLENVPEINASDASNDTDDDDDDDDDDDVGDLPPPPDQDDHSNSELDEEMDKEALEKLKKAQFRKSVQKIKAMAETLPKTISRQSTNGSASASSSQPTSHQ